MRIKRRGRRPRLRREDGEWDQHMSERKRHRIASDYPSEGL